MTHSAGAGAGPAPFSRGVLGPTQICPVEPRLLIAARAGNSCIVARTGRLDSFFTIKPAAPRPDKPKKAEPAKGTKGKGVGSVKKGGKTGGVTKRKKT